MVAKKKAENLTIEEKLAQALVPENEQPYEVPENWCWTYLNRVSNVVTGKTPSKNHSEFYGDLFPFFKPADLDMKRNMYEASEYLSEQGKNISVQIPKYSTAVCCIGSIGKSGFFNIDGTTNQQINSAIPFFNPLYLYYFVNTDCFINQLLEKASATTISIVNKSKMEQCFFPLPPLAEQQRIVERIENLFVKLDEAKEKLQEVLDSFETRKAAILHKAFTGELTAKWREEHDVDMESWKGTTVGRVCHDVKVGIVIKPSQYYTDEASGTPAFRSANVRENHIDDFDWVYLNQTGMDNNARSIVHTGDVLVVRSGNPGTACVVTDKFDGYNAIDILIAVPDYDQVTSEFLCCYTNSPFGKNLVSEKKRGMALAHFNVKGYSGLPIRIPQLAEQREIVRSLDSLFAKEQQAKEAAEAVLEKIELMKKSILARAFRGELGTNDVNDEDAVELLKSVL